MEFTQEIPIRFADVDAAGIVYYPRFFHYYHQAFEDFFGATHGTPYSEWLSSRRVGFPTAHVEADFNAPLRYGDSLHVAVTVPRVGNRSLDFRFEARSGKTEPAASAVITKVCVDMDSLKPCDFPEDLLTVLRQYAPDPG